MANIANITLAILLAAQMAGALTQREGIVKVLVATPIARNIN